jgi:hypothetical protein
MLLKHSKHPVQMLNPTSATSQNDSGSRVEGRFERSPSRLRTLIYVSTVAGVSSAKKSSIFNETKHLNSHALHKIYSATITDSNRPVVQLITRAYSHLVRSGPILTLSGVNLSGRSDRPLRIICRSSAGNGASGDMTKVVPVRAGSNGAEREA